VLHDWFRGIQLALFIEILESHFSFTPWREVCGVSFISGAPERESEVTDD
jgi:hypothetical protein